jgi:hypothetical protein
MLAATAGAQVINWRAAATYRNAPQVRPLTCGERLDNLRARRGEELHYRVYVPGDADTLDIRTGSGRGDADLYVRFGELPAKVAFDGRSTGNTSAEQIVIRQPREGWWYVTVRAFTDIDGVDLRLAHDGRGRRDDWRDDGDSDVLHGGRTVRRLSGQAGELLGFRVNVPRGADRLVVRMDGGRGDADLYLARGYEPTPKRYEHRSVGRANREQIEVRNPAAGTWYVAIYAYRDFDDAEMRIDIDGGYDDDNAGHIGGLQLTRPGRGSTWTLGETEVVTWRAAAYVRDVQIQFSLDNGRTWRRNGLPERINADLGEYFVKLPRNDRWASNRARIRIVDVDGRRLLDVSDVFRILRNRDDDHDRRNGDRYEDDDRMRRPSRIRLGEAQLRSIRPEDDQDYVMFVPPRVGTYVASFARVSTELKVDVYGLDARNRRRKLKDFEVDRRDARALIATGHDVRAIAIRVRAEDDDETGRYLLTVRAHPDLRQGRQPLPDRDLCRQGRCGHDRCRDVRIGDRRDSRHRQAAITTVKPDGSKVEHLSGRRGSLRQFRFKVPKGAKMLSVRTEDGDGRIDLYCDRGRPAGQNARWRSRNDSTEQLVRLTKPRPGWYYVTVYGRENYSGVEIATLVRK